MKGARKLRELAILTLSFLMLANGVSPLLADPPTVALEPTTKIIYPNPADVIPGPVHSSTTKSSRKAEAPHSPAVAPKSSPTTSNTPPQVIPPPASANSPVALNKGWYLRWGPWKDRVSAVAAYPSVQAQFSEPEFSHATWFLQLVGTQWTLLAGPIPEAALGRALWASEPPSAIYRP